jgi:purine-nucleoside phosphorylase
MTEALDVYSKAEEAAAAIRSAVGTVPKTAIVLGSGLGGLAEHLVNPVVLPFAGIPHFPPTTVAGHAGNLVAGSLKSGASMLMLQGRHHYYEGHDLETVTFPVRVCQRLGVRFLILTSAVGGISESLRAGNILCVVDHLNMLGTNPLRGANDDRLGTRFPDLTDAYSPRLVDLAQDEARHLGMFIRFGVYACMPGPSYETPAEIKMLRALGAHVVGMSTVPEAIAARHAGMEVLALALVTNAAAGVTGAPITHADVLAAGRDAQEKFTDLLLAIVNHLHVDPEHRIDASDKWK